MTKVLRLLCLLVLSLPAAPSLAQEAAASPGEWQAVIAGQIEAFRAHDAASALSYAGADFHQAFADPEAFVRAIEASGYQPIIESRSHSFGPYRLLSPDQVLQDVRFVDNSQSLYEAIYQLVKEPEGWRVHGVQLMKTPGVGV